MSCEWCGKEVWVKPAKVDEFRFCSRQCLGAWVTHHYRQPSSLELVFTKALTDFGIPFETEYRIGRYSCDIVLPDHRIVIELDGSYWHSLPKSKIFDNSKDIYLRQEGWEVIRFNESAVYTNLTNCLLKVKRSIALI